MIKEIGEKIAFIAMPYGERIGFLHHSEEDLGKRKTIKFDGVWSDIIKKSLPEGFKAFRADELRNPGVIDQKYMKWLFEADVVIADLTFANPNVYYEIGIRQALRKAGTVLIACAGTVLPFDLRNQTVHYYPYDEAPRLDEFRQTLKEAIQSSIDTEEIHSPVHLFLPQVGGTFESLTSDVASKPRIDRLISKLEKAVSRSGVLRLSHEILKLEQPSTSLLENLAVKLRKFDEVDLALKALEKAIIASPNDSEILRELGFCYRIKGIKYYDKAERFLNQAIELNPNDFEAFGILGGLAKRRRDFPAALSFYQCAHELEPEELYPLVTLGCIHAVMGNSHQSLELYSCCLAVADQEIKKNKSNYWAHLCKGEVIAVNGDVIKAIESYEQAIHFNAPSTDFKSAMEQLEFLSVSGISSSVCDEIVEKFKRILM